MSLVIGVPREIFPGETRVATVPEVVQKLIKQGYAIVVEAGAGAASNISDDEYRAAGAEVLGSAAEVWAKADIIFKLRGPNEEEVGLLKEGGTLVSYIWPAQNPQLMEKLAAKKATVLAMDSVPRISRAQKMDALSSQANISGYRAVIEAANAFGRFFTGQITAAGKVPPAKVFVIGAGVAGLAAIGTAANLGAIVRANDTRKEVADQIISMGGEFISVDYDEDGAGTGGYAKVMSEEFQKAQRETFAQQAKEVDIIITTALIPGKPAPKLITAEMVQSMKAGSVIVDLAAEQGGNCELTVPGEVTTVHGVTIIGYKDLPTRLPKTASTLYATNLFRLSEDLIKTKSVDPAGEGAAAIKMNMEDEVVRGTTVIDQGNVTWPPPAPKLSAAPAQPKPAAAPAPAHGHGPSTTVSSPTRVVVMFAFAALLFGLIGFGAPTAFLGHLTVVVLGCFIGYMVVWNVTPALHTPLMSVTNAISSIIVIGALVQMAPPLADGITRPEMLIKVMAGLGIVLTAINMFGGFAVTRRMLDMFRKN